MSKEKVIVLTILILALLTACQTPQSRCVGNKCGYDVNITSYSIDHEQTDKCKNISCNNSCLNNTLFYRGVCEQGICAYHQKECPNGCIKNKCDEETPGPEETSASDLKAASDLVYALANGGFEQGDANWSMRHGYVLDTTIFHSGSASVKSFNTYHDPNEDPSAGDARAIWTSYKNVKEGQKVFASAFIKSEKANCSYGLRIGLDFQTSDSKILHSVNGEFVSWGNDWTYREVNGFVRAGDYKVVLWLQTKPNNCPANAWFDDIKFQITRP